MGEKHGAADATGGGGPNPATGARGPGEQGTPTSPAYVPATGDHLPDAAGGRELRLDPAQIRTTARRLAERAEEVAVTEVRPVQPEVFGTAATGQQLGQDAVLAHEQVLTAMFNTYQGLQRFSTGLETVRTRMLQTDEVSESSLRTVQNGAEIIRTPLSSVAEPFLYGAPAGETPAVEDGVGTSGATVAGQPVDSTQMTTALDLAQAQQPVTPTTAPAVDVTAGTTQEPTGMQEDRQS